MGQGWATTFGGKMKTKQISVWNFARHTINKSEYGKIKWEDWCWKEIERFAKDGRRLIIKTKEFSKANIPYTNIALFEEVAK